MDDPILIWNEISLEANRVSHTDGSKEQNGPTLSSRALAIIHLAMYDAYAGIDKSANLPPYLGLEIEPPANTSQNLLIAVSAAAYTTLVELFPSQFDYFNAQLKLYVPNKLDPAYLFGEAAARQILDLRKDDPSASQGTFRPAKKRGVHKVDPDNPTQGYHGPFYGERSKCFAVINRNGLKLNSPPFSNGKNSAYLKALRQVRTKGIKPELTGTLPNDLGVKPRTPEEETIGVFWSYDGTAGLGTPPRLYNQIIRKIAVSKGNTSAQNARLFALVNAAMGDAAILCWEEKYKHQFWRPVIGIREHDSSFGGRDEGQPTPSTEYIDTDADPFWLPMGAPSSNSANAGVTTAQGTFPFANVQIGKVKNFTPNFPAYPSGHATFGAAAFHITRLFYGINSGDRQADQLIGNDLYFVSDEMNEKTQDNNGTVRPLHRRSFKDGLWGMIVENGLSRVFLGVHWVFDAFMVKDTNPDLNQRIGGVWLGLNIAEDIFRTGLQPPTVGIKRTLYAPVIDLGKVTKLGDNEIVLNSRSQEVKELTPTFYTEKGEAIVGAAIVLQPNEIRFVAIKDLIPAEHAKKEDWGGMSLSYLGKSMEVAAQITLNGKDGGTADVLLAQLGGSASDVQEAVWWQPKSGKAILALGNSSNESIHTSAQFSDGQTEEVEIAPLATYYLKHKAKDSNDKKKSDVELSVKLLTTGLAGSLKVNGFVISDDKKLVSSIRFYDTKNVSQPDLFATNFKVKNSKPHLLLKNTSDSSITTTPRFYPGEGTGELFELPAVTLAAGEIKELDLKPLQKAADKRKDLEEVSIHIANNGTAGSLIGSLVSRDAKSNIDFDIPLRDCGTIEHSTGAYPWRIDDDYRTVISVTYVGSQVARFCAVILSSGGKYEFKFHNLSPGETAVFDIKKIRDEQIPDQNGNVIPITTEIGQFRWSIIGTSATDEPLIARSEIINKSKKVSNSFSCGICCPSSGPYMDGFGTFDVYVGSSENYAINGVWYDCYYTSYASSPTFDPLVSAQTSIATVSQDGNYVVCHGVAPGQTSWTGDFYFSNWSTDQYTCFDDSYAAQTGGDMTVAPLVDIYRDDDTNPITNTTQTVIVGEKIKLTVKINDANQSGSNIQWTIPGEKVKDFKITYDNPSSPTPTTAIKGEKTELTDFTHATIEFYWVDSGTGRDAQCSITVNGNQYTPKVTFDVKRPDSNIGAKVSQTTIRQNRELDFGVFLFVTKPGIEFVKHDFTIPSGFTGDTVWVQTLNYTATRTFVSGSPKTAASGTVGLDNRFPYASGDPNASSSNDSPGFCLQFCDQSDITSVEVRLDATMWLMFKATSLPNGRSSIYVPLKKVTWYWQAKATIDTNGDFQLDYGNNTNDYPHQYNGDNFGVDTTDFPVWTKITGNEPFV